MSGALIGGGIGLALMVLVFLAVEFMWAVVSVRFLFKWFDFWVGWFWDSKSRRLYVLPLPMLGVVFQFEPKVEKPPTVMEMLEETERRWRRTCALPPPPSRGPGLGRAECRISGSHFHVYSDGRRFCEGSKTKDNGRRAGKIEER